ncbi:hypothetical protein C5167_047848, partial [Papaver somniferum]
MKDVMNSLCSQHLLVLRSSFNLLDVHYEVKQNQEYKFFVLLSVEYLSCTIVAYYLMVTSRKSCLYLAPRRNAICLNMMYSTINEAAGAWK